MFLHLTFREIDTLDFQQSGMEELEWEIRSKLAKGMDYFRLIDSKLLPLLYSNGFELFSKYPETEDYNEEYQGKFFKRIMDNKSMILTMILESGIKHKYPKMFPKILKKYPIHKHHTILRLYLQDEDSDY